MILLAVTDDILSVVGRSDVAGVGMLETTCWSTRTWTWLAGQVDLKSGIDRSVRVRHGSSWLADKTSQLGHS